MVSYDAHGTRKKVWGGGKNTFCRFIAAFMQSCVLSGYKALLVFTGCLAPKS